MGQMVKLVFNFITIKKKNLDKKEKMVDGRANSKRQGLGIDQRIRQSQSRKCLWCPKAGRPGQRADGKATAPQKTPLTAPCFCGTSPGILFKCCLDWVRLGPDFWPAFPTSSQMTPRCHVAPWGAPCMVRVQRGPRHACLASFRGALRAGRRTEAWGAGS